MDTAVEEASNSTLTSCAIEIFCHFSSSDTGKLFLCKMYALLTETSMQW